MAVLISGVQHKAESTLRRNVIKQKMKLIDISPNPNSILFDVSALCLFLRYVALNLFEDLRNSFVLTKSADII